MTDFTCGVEVLQELLLLGLSARLQEPAPAVVVTHILPVPQPKSRINHIGPGFDFNFCIYDGEARTRGQYLKFHEHDSHEISKQNHRTFLRSPALVQQPLLVKIHAFL